MTIASEVARVGAILREDIARAKADGLVIQKGALSGTLRSGVETCCAIGATLHRIDKSCYVHAAKALRILPREAASIAMGFDGNEVFDDWADLGRDLAKEEGLS